MPLSCICWSFLASGVESELFSIYILPEKPVERCAGEKGMKQAKNMQELIHTVIS